jgi:phosphonate transport system substrate-binding protein
MTKKVALAVTVWMVCSCDDELAVAPPMSAVHRVLHVPPGRPLGLRALRFGLMPYLSKQTLIEGHQRLADHLSKTLAVPVELVVGEDYADSIARFERGDIDLMELSPLAYAKASARMALSCVAQSIADGSASSTGYIFVRDDSPRRSVADLKGARFGFVDPMSTSGSLFPKRLLREQGVDVEKDLKAEYLGNHEAVLHAVLDGRVEAGATYQGSFAALRAHGGDPLSFRVIAKTPRSPREAYCVRAGLTTEAIEALSQALLSLSSRDRLGRETLGPLNFNGFQTFDESAYEQVRAVARELDP